MEKKVFTLGLASIEMGEVGGGSKAALGYTYQDTCKMTQEDPETTDFRVQPYGSFSRNYGAAYGRHRGKE